METANERRKRKLGWLCDKHGLDTVATEAGVNPASLDQVLKGVLLPEKADKTRSPRSLGDKAARAIEAAYELGEGWFDAPDEVPKVSDEAMALAVEYDKMTPVERQRLRLLRMAAREGIDPTHIEKAPGRTGEGDAPGITGETRPGTLDEPLRGVTSIDAGKPRESSRGGFRMTSDQKDRAGRPGTKNQKKG